MLRHDPDADYLEAELKKIDESLARLEHTLTGKPQLDPETTTYSWNMFGNAAQMQYTPPVSSHAKPILNPARRQHHLEMIQNLRLGANHAMVAVNTGGSFFKTKKQKIIVLGGVAVATILFILFVVWFSHLMHRLIYFH